MKTNIILGETPHTMVVPRTNRSERHWTQQAHACNTGWRTYVWHPVPRSATWIPGVIPDWGWWTAIHMYGWYCHQPHRDHSSHVICVVGWTSGGTRRDWTLCRWGTGACCSCWVQWRSERLVRGTTIVWGVSPTLYNTGYHPPGKIVLNWDLPALQLSNSCAVNEFNEFNILPRGKHGWGPPLLLLGASPSLES
jgi:hypothetical protein